MRVGQGDVAQDGVEREEPGVEQVRHVRQEDGHVVRAPLVHRGTGVRADEERGVAEVAGHLRREMGTRPLDVEVDDVHVPQLGGARHEGFEQGRRRSGRALDVDPVTGADTGDGLSR